MVAAIVAGDPDGLAEAYDRYAAPLYTNCRFMLPVSDPSGSAADAVQDTFVIATSRLQGLRDPDQLGSWLHAVARNECLRRLSVTGGPAELGEQPDPYGPMPAVALPAGLRERVVRACTDSTPAGRAYRVSVTHRAGKFGRTGFPEAITPSGPIWWQEVRRHPRAAAGVAAVAATVMAAGILAVLMAAGPHRAHASTLALGGGISGGAGAASGQGTSSSPGHKAAPVKDSPTPSVSGSGSMVPAGTSPGKPGPSSPAPPSSGSSPSPSPSPSSSPSPSPSPSPSQGTLAASPTKLTLTAVKGKAATGTFILTAQGGPVNDFVIHVPAKVSASPSAGSLPSAGSWVTVTVTVTSAVSLNTHLTVDPGGLIITVVLTIKA